MLRGFDSIVKSMVIVLVMGGLTLFVAADANAIVIPLEATLDGTQEVPPSGSTATGIAILSLDTDLNELSWDISWMGLSGPATAIHFHGPALVGQNAAVQVNVGPISGLTSPSIGSTMLNDTQGSDILSGLYYINIHSDSFPAGEIRGWVTRVDGAIPEPVTGALGLMGLGVLGIATRRRVV